MNIDDLHMFQVVAKEESISRAAEILNFVQSNVTTKIKRLEIEYQTKLFYRHRNGVTLTPSGKTLLTYIEKVLHLIEDSKREVKHLTSPTGKLKIGSTESTAAIRLPDVLSKYHNQYPEVELILNTESTHNLTKMVINREIEGAFIAGRVNNPLLEEMPTFEEKLMLLRKKDSPLSLEIEDLKKQTIIVFPPGCCYRRTLEDWFFSKGIIPKRFMELNTLDGIIGCIRAGLGISALTESVLNKLDPNKELIHYPLPYRNGITKTHFIYRKDIVYTSAFYEFKKLLIKETTSSSPMLVNH